MPSAAPPIILWFRRDFRLIDHPALAAAAAEQRPVIPLFILEPGHKNLGAAAKWRLEQAIQNFQDRLGSLGSRLILRQGTPADVLMKLAEQTDARSVYFMRRYHHGQVDADAGVIKSLAEKQIDCRHFAGLLLREPDEIASKSGQPYRVFKPFWNAVAQLGPAKPTRAPASLQTPDQWPTSETLATWHLGAGMNRGAAIVSGHTSAGEAAAWATLDEFLECRLQHYGAERDHPALPATSELSEYLAWGEISAQSIWATVAAWADAHGLDPSAFLRQLTWRDYGWHLLAHAPTMTRRNWQPKWDSFPWREDNADAERWRRGMTGEPIVDAGMRQLHVTGKMHNRVRMIVASYLTKHLLTHWSVGQEFFAEYLTDWDPASNALGWQWVAGSGPDAAPYFRVFNPRLQAEKFDRDGTYINRYLHNGSEATQFYEALPRHWNIDPSTPYPEPVVALAQGRDRALAAYKAWSNPE